MLSFLPILVQGIGTTLLVTALAFVFGAIWAVPLTAARMSRVKVLSFVATAYIEVFRGVPPLVWLFVIFYGIPRSFLQLTTLQAATIGLGLVAGAYIAEIYRSSIRSVRKGQWEAASALGLRGRITFLKVVLPQAVIVCIPSAITYLIGLLKDSSVASVIGTQDITTLAYAEARRSFEGMEVFLMAALLYILLSIPIAMVARATGARAARYLKR